MTHEEYFCYLRKLKWEIDREFPSPDWDDEERRIAFKLTASPHYYWLENKEALNPSTATAPSGTGFAVPMPEPPPSDGAANLSAKATEIRSKLKDFNKQHQGKYTDFMSQEAFYGLGDLIRDWAQGCRSWWMGLDSIPDSELVKWNVKHEVFP